MDPGFVHEVFVKVSLYAAGIIYLLTYTDIVSCLLFVDIVRGPKSFLSNRFSQHLENAIHLGTSFYLYLNIPLTSLLFPVILLIIEFAAQ